MYILVDSNLLHGDWVGVPKCRPAWMHATGVRLRLAQGCPGL